MFPDPTESRHGAVAKAQTPSDLPSIWLVLGPIPQSYVGSMSFGLARNIHRSSSLAVY